MSVHATAPASIYGPVEDWATDLDHADPAYNPKAPEIWAELREQGCPVAHTDRYGGMWAPITAELVREVAYDTDHFTSRAVVVQHRDPGPEAPIGGAPPITSDPPFHAARPAPAAAAVRAEADRAVGARDPRSCAGSASTTWAPSRRARPSSTPPRSTPPHPGQRDRADARLPAGGRRPVPGVRPRRARGRQPASRRSAAGLPRSSTPTSTPRSRPTAPSHATTSRRTSSTSSSAARSFPGARARLDRAAAPRRHRHDVERDRLLALAPRLAPGGPPPPGRRARPAADGDRGAAAGLRAR